MQTPTTLTARHADGRRCDRATTTRDCPHHHRYADESIAAQDRAVRAVAALLPHHLDLTADMGGSRAQQIVLRIPDDPDNPRHMAGVDAGGKDSEPTWCIRWGASVDAVSQLRLDADPATVAAWITDTYRHHNTDSRPMKAPGPNGVVIARIWDTTYPSLLELVAGTGSEPVLELHADQIPCILDRDGVRRLRLALQQWERGNKL